MSEDQFRARLERAKKRVDYMDQTDGGTFIDIPAIQTALKFGIMEPGSGAAFDALVMLSQFPGAIPWNEVP